MTDLPNKKIENELKTEELNMNEIQNNTEPTVTINESDELLPKTDSAQISLENNEISDIEKIEPTLSKKEENEETVNCLALTVQKDYRLCVVKNVFLKTLKTTWKIAISVITLNFLKFFL